MQADREEVLSNEEKDSFNIEKSIKAYRYYLDKVIEERCDEFEYILEEDGFEIVHRDYITIAANIYNYSVVVIKN